MKLIFPFINQRKKPLLLQTHMLQKVQQHWLSSKCACFSLQHYRDAEVSIHLVSFKNFFWLVKCVSRSACCIRDVTLTLVSVQRLSYRQEYCQVPFLLQLYINAVLYCFPTTKLEYKCLYLTADLCFSSVGSVWIESVHPSLADLNI